MNALVTVQSKRASPVLAFEREIGDRLGDQVRLRGSAGRAGELAVVGIYD